MEIIGSNTCTCKTLPLWVMGLSRMANKKTVKKRKRHIFNSILKAWESGGSYENVSKEFKISSQRVHQILTDVMKEIFPDDTNDNIAKRIGLIRTFIKQHKSKKICDYCKNLESFYSHININLVSGCWIWDGFRYGAHYGGFRYFKKTKYAHRLSYEMHKGEIPDGLCVCHTCDTPLCVNPKHLWIGTLAANAYDRHKKGRTRTGWDSGVFRYRIEEKRKSFTRDQLEMIDSIYKDKKLGKSNCHLAQKHKISVDTIRRIILKEGRWKYAPDFV